MFLMTSSDPQVSEPLDGILSAAFGRFENWKDYVLSAHVMSEPVITTADDKQDFYFYLTNC